MKFSDYALEAEKRMNAHQMFLERGYEQASIDHEALQERIKFDAADRLIEWQSIEGASRDAHDYELLRDEIDFIINYAANKLAEEDQHVAMCQLGFYIANKVKKAALHVATYEATK